MYGMAGVEIDGNDAHAVYTAAGDAIGRARSGNGPTLIECRTYRTRAHAEGMGDFTYRTREDVDDWKKRCPIARLRQRMSDDGATPNFEFDQIDSEVQAMVRDARAFAEASPAPTSGSATDFVYSENSRKVTAKAEPPANGALQSASREITFAQATWEALAEIMDEDPTVFVMGEGIGVRGGNFMTTKGLFAKHGAVRLCDTPICERGFVGLACGAAMTGSRPVVDFMFADFVLDSIGEIFNQIAKMHRDRSFRCDSSFRQLLRDVRPGARSASRRAVQCVRCERLDEAGTALRRSSRLSRTSRNTSAQIARADG
jgi:2-oxoisovalerate dehydrogenase E1 component